MDGPHDADRLSIFKGAHKRSQVLHDENAGDAQRFHASDRIFTTDCFVFIKIFCNFGREKDTFGTSEQS